MMVSSLFSFRIIIIIVSTANENRVLYNSFFRTFFSKTPISKKNSGKRAVYVVRRQYWNFIPENDYERDGFYPWTNGGDSDVKMSRLGMNFRPTILREKCSLVKRCDD